jgi:hypothetical protein
MFLCKNIRQIILEMSRKANRRQHEKSACIDGQKKAAAKAAAKIFPLEE